LKRQALQQAIKQMIQAHHEAFVVELFGRDRLGMSAADVQSMWDKDLFPDPKMLRGVMIPIPGFAVPINPFEYTMMVASAIGRATSEQRTEMRGWGIDEWADTLKQELAIRDSEQEAYDREKAANMATQPVVQILKPDTPSTEPPVTKIPISPDVDAPEWMSSEEVFMYAQAATRAGEFCRGLGNKIAENWDESLAERWDGDQIVEEIDPEKREETIALIREKVSEAVEHHANSGELARELARATGNWTHNWERIARTELQAVYNEGVFLDAVQDYGADTRIARMPESDACSHCLRLFVDGSSLRVFPAQELLSNGTNVGRPAASWVATIFPVHPNCRCDTIAVPPGMFVTRDGLLRSEPE